MNASLIAARVLALIAKKIGKHAQKLCESTIQNMGMVNFAKKLLES